MERVNGYGFFANHFLVLPNKEYVNNLRNYEYSDDSESSVLFKSFFEANKALSDEELLEKINIERTYLVRGIDKNGPKPPYESVYSGRPQGDTVLELAEFYSKAGFAMSENLREAADYIGVELSFMQQLCMQEENGEDTLELQYEFFTKHLGKWGKEFATDILKNARTDFYGAVGTMLYDFLDEEEEAVVDNYQKAEA